MYHVFGNKTLTSIICACIHQSFLMFIHVLCNPHGMVPGYGHCVEQPAMCFVCFRSGHLVGDLLCLYSFKGRSWTGVRWGQGAWSHGRTISLQWEWRGGWLLYTCETSLITMNGLEIIYSYGTKMICKCIMSIKFWIFTTWNLLRAWWMIVVSNTAVCNMHNIG